MTNVKVFTYLSSMNRIKLTYFNSTLGYILVIYLFSMLLTGCAASSPKLSNKDMLQREIYTTDKELQLLVNITLDSGKQNTNYDVLRKYLELDLSRKGSVDRKFFEIEYKGENNYSIFFLENKGAIDNTDMSEFPEKAIERIDDFYGDLKDDQQNEYLPVAVKQYKIIKKMKLEKNNGKTKCIFSTGVIGVEKYTLFGLLYLKLNSFVFFGINAEEVGEKDYLDADSNFKKYIELFLKQYQDANWYLL